MDERAPVEVVGADQRSGESSAGEVDRRPPWLLAAIVVTALVAVVVVSLLTRENSPTADNEATPATSAAPATTEPPSVTTTTTPANTTATTSRTPVTVETFTPGPTVIAVGDTEVELLALSQDLVDALPPGGIDGWLFSIREANQLTRTDLTTGEEARIVLDNRSGDSFFPGMLGIVRLKDKVVVSGDGHLSVVDIDTLETTRIEHEHGVVPILANDDSTVWLRTLSSIELASSMISINIDTLEVSEPFTIDPFNIAFVVAGAGDGSLRFHVPFVGSWEFSNGVRRKLDNSILAGVNGGTLEVSCGDDPAECVVLIHDFATQTETPIQVRPEVFGSSISPNLDAVALSDRVVYTDGSTVALRPNTFDGTPLVWSSDGRFLVNSELSIIDLTGELDTFTVPGSQAFSSGPIATALVMRHAR